jgi:hypothetical protein
MSVEPHTGQNLIVRSFGLGFALSSFVSFKVFHPFVFFFHDFFSSLFLGSLGFLARGASATAKARPHRVRSICVF